MILVTGCAGFIGWRVCDLLMREGNEVVGADNLNDAYDRRLKVWRLQQLQDHAPSQFHFFCLDITDHAAMAALWQREGPFEAVINLAARAGVRQSLADPWIYYHTNVNGALNLLDHCRENGVKKFVLASSSSVYGDGGRPFREDQPTDRPLSPYAASKKAAETLCYTYYYLYGLDVTVLRYFTVFGPSGRPDMSIFRFIRWIAEEEALVLYGDGTQERDFTYVDDIARGTLLALRPLGFEIVNLGSDRPVAVREVIGLLEGLLDKKACIQEQPPHPADVPATWADISKARRLLNWTPETTLQEGLRKAVEWYKQNNTWANEVSLT